LHAADRVQALHRPGPARQPVLGAAPNAHVTR
jgi:hypothetical protein